MMIRSLSIICLAIGLGDGALNAAAKDLNSMSLIEHKVLPPLILDRRVYVPEGKRWSVIRQKIVLDEKATKTILSDHEKGVPLIFALVKYQGKDGKPVEKCVNGRILHLTLKLRRDAGLLPVDPVSQDPLVGHPKYYTAKLEYGRWKIAYLGSEKDAMAGGSVGEFMRSMISVQQDHHTWHRIAQLYLKEENWPDAREWFEKVEYALREDDTAYGEVLNNIGYTYAREGDVATALEIYQGALSIVQNQQVLCGYIVGNIAASHLQRGDFGQSVEWFERAVAVLKEEKEPYGHVLFSLCKVLEKVGKFSRAIECGQRAVFALQEEGQHYGHVLASIGDFYAKNSELGHAIGWLERAVAVLKEENRPYGNVIRNIGCAHLELGDPNRALEYFIQAKQALQNERQSLIGVSLDTGTVYAVKEEWDNLIASYKQALSEQKTHEMRAGLLNDIGYAYEKKGDFAQAYDYYKQALACDWDMRLIYSLMNILYLYADESTHEFMGTTVSAADMRCYAKAYMDIPSDSAELFVSRTKYAERFIKAKACAERIMAEDTCFEDYVA
jgi:tetratricopeptide (TPR) repeat protein